jgi:DNA replication and repair protein RecF
VKVERLTLRSFRNVAQSTLVPDPKLNFLIGRNGQGKTSFLEALGFLATLRSFRGSKAPEVIRWGSDAADVDCVLSASDPESGHWRTDLRVSFAYTDPDHRKASKVAFINQKPFRSSTQYLSQRFGSFELGFHTVIFNPADHDLVRGEPAVRRAFLDRVLAAEDVDYLKTIQKYQRVLEQRNAVLRESDAPRRDLLLGFTEPLARYAAQVAYKRLQWIQRAEVHLNETMRQLAPEQPFLKLVYLSNWVPKTEHLSIPFDDLGRIQFGGHDPLPSLELLEQAFWKAHSVCEAAEWRSRHSLVGSHRDDWAFLLGDQPLKGHGSQGEVRSALLALKISEIGLFRNATGHRPLFLLDDFSSELDTERRSFLLRYLSETDLQVFVTTTEEASLGFFRGPLAGQKFRVVNGELEKFSDEHTRERIELEPGS